MEAFYSGKIRDYRLPIYNNVKFLSEEGSHLLVRRERLWVQEYLEKPVNHRRRNSRQRQRPGCSKRDAQHARGQSLSL